MDDGASAGLSSLGGRTFPGRSGKQAGMKYSKLAGSSRESSRDVQQSTTRGGVFCSAPWEKKGRPQIAAKNWLVHCGHATSSQVGVRTPTNTLVLHPMHDGRQ